MKFVRGRIFSITGASTVCMLAFAVAANMSASASARVSASADASAQAGSPPNASAPAPQSGAEQGLVMAESG